MQNRRLKTKRACKPLEWITPNLLLDLAYLFHVANGPETEGTPTGELARRQVSRFRELVEKHHDGPEANYLSAVSAVLISLANGIARNKRELQDAIRAAEVERDEMRQALVNTSHRSVIGRLGINAVRAALLGGLGFAIVKAFAPSIELASSANTNYMSFASAMGLMLVGSYIQSWLNDYGRDRIFLHYEHNRQFALKRYAVESRAEYNLARINAVSAWKAYTGCDYQWSPGYDEVLERELDLMTGYYGHRKVLSEPAVVRAWRWARGQHVTATRVVTAKETGS